MAEIESRISIGTDGYLTSYSNIIRVTDFGRLVLLRLGKEQVPWVYITEGGYVLKVSPMVKISYDLESST